ncbi:MAG: DUF4266 domain-containing protein [Candidatus Polarisedimenticolaceae bacterium]|nr:DUF4266 domain-containing protein [Candidatus Polarisedimenticolaceae bacterium]
MRQLLLLLALLSGLLTGCAVDVKPWQRGLLAEQKMQLVADPMEQFFDEHIFFSKEAASGGKGVGGGGCGCN